MKISIITVCRNASATIGKTLESIQCQTYSNIEKIIVDGLSCDGTQGIVQQFLKLEDKFVSEKDAGIYYAMNKGVTMATGAIVYFLNADDYFADDDVVADVMAAFIATPSCVLIYGRILYVGLPHGLKTHTTSYQISSLVEFMDNSICHQAVFAKRQLFKDCGSFDTDLKLYADRDWMLRVYSRYPANFRYFDRQIANCLYEGFTVLRLRTRTFSVLVLRVSIDC